MKKRGTILEYMKLSVLRTLSGAIKTQIGNHAVK